LGVGRQRVRGELFEAAFGEVAFVEPGEKCAMQVESQEFRSESFEVRSEHPIADLSGEAVTDECDPRQTFGQYGKEEVDLVAEDRVEHRLGQAGSAGDLFGRRGCEATTA
jgi:hypothetical protein